MLIIGFDCGIKSFAISINRYNTLKQLKILYINVYDLLKDKNTKNMKVSDNIIIAKELKHTFKSINNLINKYKIGNEKITILIEFQLGLNIKSKTISSYCIYEFCDKYNVEIIFPSLKTKYTFSENLILGKYIEKYSTNYTAQKKCSIDNFLFKLKLDNQLFLIQHIKKKNLDDVSDAFMMCFGWCTQQHLI